MNNAAARHACHGYRPCSRQKAHTGSHWQVGKRAGRRLGASKEAADYHSRRLQAAESWVYVWQARKGVGRVLGGGMAAGTAFRRPGITE